LTLDLDEIRQRLHARRAELEAELDDLTEVPRDPMGTLSFGKRIGEGTNEAIDRLTKVGAAKELSAMLADVKRALAKLDERTYGICDSCGAPIPRERLEARAWTARCVRCASLR
jgi:DnaK suppressor protein